MKKVLYQSPLGPLVLIATRGSLVYCNWDVSECLPKQLSIEKSGDCSEENMEDEILLRNVSTQLDEYFAGNRTDFEIPLDLRGTEFRKKVWRSLSNIKYGETLPYRTLAEKIGNPKAIRAVAQACGANPLAIILPCHRVIGANGNLGGYTGGVDKKIALLSLEKIKNLKTFDHNLVE